MLRPQKTISKHMKTKFFIVILMILSASSFFNPLGTIDTKFSKTIYYGCVIYGLFFFRKRKESQKLKYPRVAYKMVIFGMIGAVIMAALYQNQSLGISVMAALPYLFGYLSFLVFMKSGLSEKQILCIISGMLCCSIFIYAVNYATFPFMVFGNIDADNVDSSRGVLRIGVKYVELHMLAVFYSINQWLLHKEKKWFLAMVICGLMIVLSVTRQIIAVTAMLSGLFLLNRLRLYQKIIFIILVIMSTMYVLPEIPIYKALVENTQVQAERNENEDDIRIRAAQYYMNEYQTNNMTRIFGNGIPSIGNSTWGNKFEQDTRHEGYYSSDIGWIGYYWHFGLISVLGVLFLLLNSAIKKKTFNHEYLTYQCYAIILLSILSAQILIYYQVINFMMVLYLIYGTHRKEVTLNPMKI